MKRFQKLSSVVILLLAFIYPPVLVQAKDITQNNVLNEQSVETETNLVPGKDQELLLAHRRYRRHYRRYRRNRGHYYRHRNYYRHHYHRRRYRHGRYYGYGQPYRHGQWELIHNRHGQLQYEWRRY
ncbi:hypothetical protein [Nostoc sp. TCL26-01]|uniref:hypothetical protein n=1 Tax=Nostoc sp. TCL26-01 TaxID=2576904 RepID=UPI0015BB6C2D|nr:hypothetical protein [Nostoc sp. TCL26-01]QLE59021.1 hypothetical protein FD725_28115 [Nostoc sp. TCL26-01]